MIGDAILKQRVEMGLSIQQVTAQTGCDCSIISDLELKKRKFVSEEVFNRLSRIFDLKDYTMYIWGKGGPLLGEMLKGARLEKGLTQQELAYLCGWKDKSSISKLETGTYHKIARSTFLKLQQILSLDEKEFEPFIECVKNETKYVRVTHVDRFLLQRLIKERRKQLKLTQGDVSFLANVNPATVRKLEIYPEKPVNVDKIAAVLESLRFTKEQILAYIGEVEEEQSFQKKKKKKN